MSRFRPLAVIGVAVVALQALLVLLFAGPAAYLEPRHLPIAVAGPTPAAEALAAALDAAHPGAFDVMVVPTAASADSGIRSRTFYGAIVLGEPAPTVRVTSAGSPAVAALLTQAAAELGATDVVDVVATDPHDPRGVGLATAFLPLAMAAALAGVLLFLLAPGRQARLLGLLGVDVLAGLGGAAVLQYGLGVLPGDYTSSAAAIGLLTLAIAAPITGLGALLGRAGVALGVVVVFLIGSAWSAVAAAPELLPAPWGAIGHYLPVGSGVFLLRSVAFFGGRGATPEAATLIAYVIGGLVLVMAGRRDSGLRPTETDRLESEATPVSK